MARDSVILERRYVRAGETFIYEGERAFSAFLIQSGRVSVYSKSYDGDEIEIATLTVGDICGEMSLINEKVRTASVKAVIDCNLIVITKSVFEDKLENSDPTIRAIVSMLIDRVQHSNSEVLDKNQDISSLIKSANLIYKSILKDVDPKKTAVFERKVKPKLESFINALDNFIE